jgi:hypothetical protein
MSADADPAAAYVPEEGGASHGEDSGNAAESGWSAEAPAAAAAEQAAGGGEGHGSGETAETWGEWNGAVNGADGGGSDPNLTYRISSPGGVAPTSEAKHTALSMGDEVPNFAGFSQLGRIEFHDYIAGGWSVLLTFARSFDPVSMTEIGQLAKLAKHFEARSVNVLGLVQDSVLMLSSFLTDVATIEQCKVDLPIVVRSAHIHKCVLRTVCSEISQYPRGSIDCCAAATGGSRWFHRAAAGRVGPRGRDRAVVHVPHGPVQEDPVPPGGAAGRGPQPVRNPSSA